MTQIYHYTTVDALLGILNEKEKICLWATDYRYLNDPYELTTGTNIAKQLLPDIENTLRISPKNSISARFTKDNLLNFNYFSSMIISLSENADSLPMWGMYGKHGKGIGLIFDKEKLLSSCKEQCANNELVCTMDECIYYSLNYEGGRKTGDKNEMYEENRDIMIEVLADYYNKALKMMEINELSLQDTLDGIATFILSNFCPFIKDCAYYYEQEHRISIRLFPPDFKINLKNELKNKNINDNLLNNIANKVPVNYSSFRERNGILVPFTKVFFQKMF